MLNIAYEAWQAGAPLRAMRRRFKNYTYGRQWDDMVNDPTAGYVTEREAAEASGAHPMTNNMIRQLVKCITGNFRNRMAEERYDDAEQEMRRRNSLNELDSRMLEEFLISGCAVQRVVHEHRPWGDGVWVDNVSPERFFVNRFTDPRGTDIELVGMLHDWSLREVMMRFASDDAERRRVAEIFGRAAACGSAMPTIDSFYTPAPGRCRVIEVWTLESRSVVKCMDPEEGSVFMIPGAEHAQAEQINRERLERGGEPMVLSPRVTARWHCRYYAPGGEVLDEFDSPYAHGMHPFAVKFYPLTDGEVHSFVEDVIDQQRSVNRIITLIDHVLGVSAKGVLFFPEDCLMEGHTMQDIARMWSRPGAVIPMHQSYTGQRPEQMSGGTEPGGAYKLLDTELRLLQQVSGVNEALQGRLESGNASAALYDSQVRNSSVAILDLVETFNDFRRMRDYLANNS